MVVDGTAPATGWNDASSGGSAGRWMLVASGGATMSQRLAWSPRSRYEIKPITASRAPGAEAVQVTLLAAASNATAVSHGRRTFGMASAYGLGGVPTSRMLCAPPAL